MGHPALYGHQQGHFDRMLDTLQRHGVAGDMSETGTGKTAVALALAATIGVVPLVIAPASVAPAWRKLSAQLGIPAQVVSYQFATRNMCRKQKVGRTGTRIELLAPPSFVILDEAHMTRGEKSLWSKIAIALKRQEVDYVLLLSATLIGPPTDLKAIGYLLGLHQGTNFWNWQLAHGCRPGVFGGLEFTTTPKHRTAAMNRISAKLVGKVHMMRRKDIKDFPETKIETILVDDDQGQAEKLSDEVRDALRIRREQQNGLVAEIAELRNLGNGFAEDGSPAHQHMLLVLRKRQELELLKVPALVEMAAKYGPLGGVAIFVCFNETLEAVHAAIGPHHCGIVRGGQSANFRQSEVDKFQSGALPYIVLNVAAGGAGISLQATDGVTERTTLISPDYSAINFKQVLGRPHRLGGGFSRQFIVLFDNATDRRIASVLNGRLDTLDSITDADLTPA